MSGLQVFDRSRWRGYASPASRCACDVSVVWLRRTVRICFFELSPRCATVSDAKLGKAVHFALQCELIFAPPLFFSSLFSSLPAFLASCSSLLSCLLAFPCGLGVVPEAVGGFLPTQPSGLPPLTRLSATDRDRTCPRLSRESVELMQQALRS